jgi:guanine nucleotide-binding protein alpha-1 subunit
MQFARDKWIEERVSWRAVILLNLVRSANTILDAFSQEKDDEQFGLDDAFTFDDYYRRYRLRLSPVLQTVENNLKRLLGAKPDEIELRKPARPILLSPRTPPEFFVRSRTWRNFIQSTQGPEFSGCPAEQDLPNIFDSTEAIANCKDDIKSIWSDDIVQAMLAKRRIRLEDSASL